MPDDKEPIPKFAARIKAKYPQYKDIDDTLLAHKIVDKYPEYRDMVDFGPEPSKKKETALPKLGDIFGALSGRSSMDGQTVLNGDVKFIPGSEVKKKEEPVSSDDDPIKEYMTPHRKELGERYTNYLNAARPQTRGESTNQVATSRILKDKIDRENTKRVQMDANAVVTLKARQKEAERTLFPDAHKAAELLGNYAANKGISVGDLLDPSDETINNLPKNNETVKAGIEQINDYKKVLSEITNANGNIEDAAINRMRKDSPVYNEKISKIMEGNKYDPTYANNIPESERGRIVWDYIHNPNVEVAASKDLDTKERFENLKHNFLSIYPEFAETLVSNKLSQAREDRGKNNPVLNIVGKETMDKIANEVLTPEENQVYVDKIRPKIRGKIDTPGFVENLATSTKETISGIGATINELSPGTESSDLLRDSMDKNAKTVAVQPKGAWNKFGNLTGKFAGIVLPIGYGGRLLQGLKVATSAEGANAMMTGLTFYGHEKEHARELMPKDEVGQNLYALGATSAYMFASNIFKDFKALDGLTKEMRPTLSNIIKEYNAGAISKEAARDAATNAFKEAATKTLELGKETVKQNTKSAIELTAIQYGKNMMEKILTPESYNASEHEKMLANTFIQTWLGTTPMGLAAAYGNVKQKPVLKEGIYHMAYNPEPYREAIKLQSLTDPSHVNIQNKLNNLDYIVKVKEELDKNPNLTERQKKSYLLQSLNEKMIEDTKPEEPTLKKQADEKIKQSQINKEQILSGKDVDELPHEQKEEMPDDKLEKELLKVAPEGYKEHHKVLKSEGKESGWLGYMADKAAENPDKFIQEFGDDLFDRMIEKVGTKKLENSLNYLKDNIPEDANIPLLEQILEQRYDKHDKEAIEGTKKPRIIVSADELEAAQPKRESQTDDIRQRYIDDFNIVESSAFDWRVTSSLSTKDRLKAVEDIKSGKDTAAARTLEKEIQEMKDRGTVVINRGRGSQVETVEIPVNEWFGLTPKEQDHVLKSSDKIDEDSARMINESGITLQNIDNLKHLFDGFPYEQSDFQAVKDYLTRQGEGGNKTSSTGEEVGAQKAVVPESKEPPPTQEKISEDTGQEEVGRLAHADTEKIYKEHGLPERLETPTKNDVELEAAADKLVKKGYDFDKESEKVMKGEKNSFTDEEQIAFAKMVHGLKEKQKGLDIKSPEFEALQDKIEKYSRASDVVGTLEGRAFRARQNYVPKDETLSDYVMREKKVNKDAPLTDQQKETVQKEYTDISETDKKYQEKIAALEAENARLQAEKNIPKPTVKKSSKERLTKLSEERTEIFASIKDKLKKARGEANVTPVPYAKELFVIAPDVAKLVKNLVDTGVTKFADVVKEIHGRLKEDIPDITEKDVHNIIAGEYNTKKPPRNELARQVFELKQQAQLLNKLEWLLKGEEPKSEKKKIKRNQEIESLRKQIKDIKDFDKEVEAQKEAKAKIDAEGAKGIEKDLSKAEKELDNADAKAEKERKRIEKEQARKTPEERALAAYKTKTQKKIDELNYKLKTGDFDAESAPKKEPLKLDAEAQKLKDQLIKLKQDREIRLLKQEYANRSKGDKIWDTTLQVLNIPRTIMASMDFSGLLRQGIFAGVSHPRTALKAQWESFFQAGSQKRFDEWFYDVQKDPRYEKMKEAGLFIADPHDPKLTAKEEAFMGNLAEKIPFIGREVKIRGGEGISIPGTDKKIHSVGGLIKGSERAYVGVLNKLRYDLFTRFAERYEADGRTMENSPEFYKHLADYINNSTGRGNLGWFEAAAPVLNSLFFSPRLIASRVNLLTMPFTPKFWTKVPKEVRIMYVKDMLKFVGLGMAVLGLAKLNGADVEDDPRSTDFGKIKSGNTRWDIWGGFQPYVRLTAQLATGEKKSTGSGEIKELNGEGAFGENRLDVANRFFRGKLSPVIGSVFNLASGRDIVGNPTDLKTELGKSLTPLIYQDISDAMKDRGVSSLFTVLPAATFGIGVNTYQQRPNSAKPKPKKSKPQKKKQT